VTSVANSRKQKKILSEILEILIIYCFPRSPPECRTTIFASVAFVAESRWNRWLIRRMAARSIANVGIIKSLENHLTLDSVIFF